MYVFPWCVVRNNEDSSTIMFSFWVLEENNNNNIWSIMNVWSCEFRHGKTVGSGSGQVNQFAGQIQFI